MGILCVLAVHLLQCRSSLLLHPVSGLLLLCFLYCIIIAQTVSLGKPSSRSTCSIFSLCMESNAWEKSINNSDASRISARTTSRIRRIVNIWFRGSISPKAILVLPKYFIKPCCFLIFIFFSTETSSSRVNCPSLMSSWLLINFGLVHAWLSSKFSRGVFVLLGWQFSV